MLTDFLIRAVRDAFFHHLHRTIAGAHIRQQLSISAFAFRKDQRDTFVDVVSLAAKVRPHRMAITAVSDVGASARFDGVYVNFTITVPGADEKLVAPMLATLTMDPMPNGFADRLAEKGLPTLIAVVKACAAWPSVHVCARVWRCTALSSFQPVLVVLILCSGMHVCTVIRCLLLRTL